MARKTKTPDTTPPTPPKVVLQPGQAPKPAPTAAERFAAYARMYPERVPVLPDEGSVMILNPLGFYERHDVRDIRGVTRRALRDSAKALHREMLAAAVPADWQLPAATRFETDGARGLAPAPDSEPTPAPEAPSLDDM